MQEVAALDIDGVLTPYPDCWINFVCKKTTKVFNTLKEVKDRLSYSEYRRLKHEYRNSDYKLNLPLKPGAKEFVDVLKKVGYKIVLITSRPFDDYPNLRMLTTHWLQMYGIPFDDLIYSRHKHVDIILSYPNLKFMVEDNRTYSNEIAKLGYPVYLVNNQYNQGDLVNGVVRVDDFDEIVLHRMYGGDLVG